MKDGSQLVITFDLTKPEDLNKATQVINLLNGIDREDDIRPKKPKEIETAGDDTSEETPEPKRKRRAAPKATKETPEEPAAELEKGSVPEPKDEKEPEVKDETPAAKETGVSMDDLREAMGAKVKDHRDEIKSKLTEMGAKNLLALPEPKYADFLSFLKNL